MTRGIMLITMSCGTEAFFERLFSRAIKEARVFRNIPFSYLFIC